MVDVTPVGAKTTGRPLLWCEPLYGQEYQRAPDGVVLINSYTACSLAQNQVATPDREHFWEWLVTEGHFLNNRTNLFLLAEAMLLGACATLAAASNRNVGLVVYVLIGIGIVTSILWLYVSGRSYVAVIVPLRNRCIQCEPRFSLSTGSRTHPWPRVSALLSWVFPIVFIIAWLTFGSAYTLIPPARPQPFSRYQLMWSETGKHWLVFDSSTGRLEARLDSGSESPSFQNRRISPPRAGESRHMKPTPSTKSSSTTAK